MGCKNHPDVSATRICSGCDTEWCGSCVRVVGTREVCASCGRQVRALAVKKGVLSNIGDSFVRVFSLEGLVSSAAIAIAYALGSLGGGMVFTIIYLAALASYYFVIVRHVGDGRDGLPGPSDSVLDWNDTIGVALRGMLCVVVGFAPLIVWRVLDQPMDLSTFVILVLAGQAYMPAVVLAVTVTNSTWAVVYPVVWLQVIGRAPGSYVGFAFVWIGSIVFGLVLVVMAGLLLPDTIIGAYGAGLLWALFWFAQAALVGHYLRENADAFGWSTMLDSAPSARVEPDEPARVAAPAEAAPPRPDNDPRYAPTRARRPSRMPSSIPLDGVAPPAPDRTGGMRAMAYATTTLTLSPSGLDALREDGSRHVIAWSDIVGAVVRRSPQSPLEEAVTFVDIVSAPGATLRILPWTQLGGVDIPGTTEDRARRIVQIVMKQTPGVQVDTASRGFVDGGPPPQLPDEATFREHDRRLA